jgi:hypothetical protein
MHCYLVIEPAPASMIPCKVCGQMIRHNDVRLRFYRINNSPSCVHARCVPISDGILFRCSRKNFLAVAPGVSDTVVSEIEETLNKFHTQVAQLTLVAFNVPHTPTMPYVAMTPGASRPSSGSSVKTRLTQHREIMAALPSYYALPGSSEAATECTICLEPFSESIELTRLPCMCKFHRSCITEWLARRACCPTDLSEVSLSVFDLT